MTWTELRPLSNGSLSTTERPDTSSPTTVPTKPSPISRQGSSRPATRPLHPARRPGRMDPGLRLTPAPVRSAPRPASRVERQHRLPLQDEWVFESTVAELARVDPRPRSMVELGSGSSRALEIFMSSIGCVYSAVDAHSQAMADRIRAGANANRCHVTQLDDLSTFRDFQFDLSFSRASLGWMPDADRRQKALAEHLRVGWRSLVINFDWSTASGGEAYNEMRDAMTGVLEPMGFDPFYGAIQHAEVRSLARAGARVETHIIKAFGRRFHGVVLASAKGVLSSPASRHRDRADELVAAAQREMADGARFSLPAIVATHCF